MNTLLQIGLTNAGMAAVLALLAALTGKFFRRPALAHALWLLVLLKLLTPPLVVIPVDMPDLVDDAAETAVIDIADEPPAPEPEAALPPVVAPLKMYRHKSFRKHLPDGLWTPPPLAEPAEPTAALPAAVHLAQDSLLIPLPEPLREDEPLELASRAWVAPDFPWPTLLGYIWLAGSAAWFMVALVRICRFQRVLANGEAAPPALQREASELAMRLGLNDCPLVWVVPGVVSPLLWALIGYPRLLLPANLLTRLDAQQRQTLLAHELAHYRRRDHWVRCLEFLALGLYWWLPVVWWARRELREAEEECCDAWVMWTLPQAAKAYASALVETLDFLSGTQSALPPAASGLGQLELLRRRLTMIMRGTMHPKLGGLGFLGVLALGLLLVPLWPTLAQPDQAASNDQGIPTTRTEQPPPKDLDKAKRDLEKAARQLDELKAHLQELQKQVNKQTTEYKRAQEQLKQAEKQAEKQRVQIEQKKKGPDFAKKGGGGLDPDTARKLLEFLQQSGAFGKDFKIDQKVTKDLQDFMGKLKTPATVIGVKGVAPPGQPGQPGQPSQPGQGFQYAQGPAPNVDRRLADLERKLDQVLREIQDIRAGKANPPKGAGGPPKAKKDEEPKKKKKDGPPAGGQGGGGGVGGGLPGTGGMAGIVAPGAAPPVRSPLVPQIDQAVQPVPPVFAPPVGPGGTPQPQPGQPQPAPRPAGQGGGGSGDPTNPPPPGNPK